MIYRNNNSKDKISVYNESISSISSNESDLSSLAENSVKEATETGLGYEEEKEKQNGFENYDRDFEDMVNAGGMSQGLARSEELASDPTYSDFFRDPKIMSTFTEHFDLNDSSTRKGILALNEAEQLSVLTSLTSKLYDNIIEKIDDIDYGEIPASKGDITKLPNYDKLVETLGLVRSIVKEYKQDTSVVDEISTAISNVSSRKELFEKAFRMKVELPIVMYNNTVLSIINAVSYMIATSIEFIKTPSKDSFQTVFDRVGYTKTKNHTIYKTLAKFNESCKKGDFDSAMNHVISGRMHGLGEAAIAGFGGAIASAFAAVPVAVKAIMAVLAALAVLREMIFLFYYSRIKMSDYIEIQAELLEMNANNLKNGTSTAKTGEDTSKVVEKQLKVVEWFKKLANKISFTNKKAEVETQKEINNTSKMKLNDLDDELPKSVSALF